MNYRKTINFVLSTFLFTGLFFQIGCGSKLNNKFKSTTTSEETLDGSSLNANTNNNVVINNNSTTASSIGYTEGKHYGHCFQQFDAGFNATYSAGAVWPMTSCPGSGSGSAAEPVCDSGFNPHVISIVQANSSSAGSSDSSSSLSAVQTKLNQMLDADVYSKISVCIKDNSQPTHQFLKGEHYGGCVQQLDAGFKVTYGSSPLWPMKSCPTSGLDPAAQPTCEAGFIPSVTFTTQMNAASSSSTSSAYTLAAIQDKINNFLNYDVYWRIYSCVKN